MYSDLNYPTPVLSGSWYHAAFPSSSSLARMRGGRRFLPNAFD